MQNWTGAPGPEPLGIRAGLRMNRERYTVVPLVSAFLTASNSSESPLIYPLEPGEMFDIVGPKHVRFDTWMHGVVYY